MSIVSQDGAAFCHAKSDKYWVQDPSGIAWEAYHTLDSAPTFNDSAEQGESTCCAPITQQVQFAPRRSK